MKTIITRSGKVCEHASDKLLDCEYCEIEKLGQRLADAEKFIKVLQATIELIKDKTDKSTETVKEEL